MSDGPDRLVGLLGAEPAKALRLALALRHLDVEVAVPEWTAHGHTGARLGAVIIASRQQGRHPAKCLVKVCPPGPYSRESASHVEAIESSPRAFVRAHLVRLAFDPIACPDGTVLLGQEVAGDSLARCRPLSTLADAELATAGGAVVTALLRQWTGTDYGLSAPTPVGTLLRRELRDSLAPGGWLGSWAAARGLLAPGSARVSTAEDGVLTNPLFLTLDGATGNTPPGQYLTGRTHGDLHDDNVLVPRAVDGRLQPAAFRLIDLTTFDAAAPLSRDPAMLLLAVVSRRAGTLPPRQRDALIHYLVSAAPESVPDLPPSLVAVVDAIRDVRGAPFVGRGLRDEWDRQLLISMLAAALLHSTYDSVGRPGRWWCLRLAAHLAERLAPTSAPAGADAEPLPITPDLLDPPPSPRSPAGPAPPAHPPAGTPPPSVHPPAGTPPPAHPPAGTPPSAHPPAGTPAPARTPAGVPRPLSLPERAALVDLLFAVPGLRDPALRQRVYDDLPPGVVQQLPRDTVVRQELFNLVHVFEDYRVYRPWPALVAVLRVRFPGGAAIDDLVRMLAEIGRLDGADLGS